LRFVFLALSDFASEIDRAKVAAVLLGPAHASKIAAVSDILSRESSQNSSRFQYENVDAEIRSPVKRVNEMMGRKPVNAQNMETKSQDQCPANTRTCDPGPNKRWNKGVTFDTEQWTGRHAFFCDL
jgi:hypothetical protein